MTSTAASADKAVAEFALRFGWELTDVKAPFKSLCIGLYLQEDLFFRIAERKVHPGHGDGDVGWQDEEEGEAWEKVGAEKKDFGLETKWKDL
ncbi:hypothetical protein SLS55_008888 [Diplodia seriata]|uniref:Uncharacterized protein n=1 Tax=Diplodia seriata TaxID=420778 RepID=A0ABR3C784_9PEZI